MPDDQQRTERKSRQEVSNRSILRVQIISKRLCEELKLIPAFKANKVIKVLFAARDEISNFSRNNSNDPNKKREWYKPGDPNARLWYDFRLCDNESFDNEVIRSWMRAHVHEFAPLFRAAHHEDRTTQADFQTFQKAVKDAEWDKAHEQFLIALAVIPYRGALLTLFENHLNWPAKDKNRERACFGFSGRLESMKFRPYEKFQPEGDFRGPEPQDEFRLHPDLSDYEGRKWQPLWYLFRFILPFTRGEKVLENVSEGAFPYPPEPGFEEETNREQTVSQEPPTEMHGFTVPACDYDEQRGQWRGGMGGWIVVVTEKAPDKTAPEDDTSWKIFTQILLRRYLHDVREAHMLDLLEEYAALSDPPDPDGYFKEHLHHLIGWRWDYAAEGTANDPGKTPKIPFDAPTPDFTLHITPLWDTFWPDPDKEFFVPTRRLLKTFLEDIRLVHAQRQAGKQSGFLASAHDYSKDIGSVLLRLERHKEDLERTAKSVSDKAKQVATLASPAAELGAAILEDLRYWNPPRFDSFANVRFTNAHLETQTRGVLVPEPAECVAMLERGTLRDIYEIVRILVWHPIPFQKLKEKEREYTKFAPEKLRHPSTWWNLFMFDLDPPPGTLGFHERLGRHLLRLILDDQIDQPTFARRFKIPRICPGIAFDDARSILWPDTEPLRWRPLNGLLPLFVFSMRFAFQCAWAKTLLEEPAEPLCIRIEADASQHRKYELTLCFPSPLDEADLSFDGLPYSGEWRAQIRHYTASQTAPWKVTAETDSVTPVSLKAGRMIRIRLLASI